MDASLKAQGFNWSRGFCSFVRDARHSRERSSSLLQFTRCHRCKATVHKAGRQLRSDPGLHSLALAVLRRLLVMDFRGESSDAKD
jgi:hypothetical protein